MVKQPYLELELYVEGRHVVLWVSPEIEDGCRDVLVYEVKNGDPNYLGAGIWGNSFVPIDSRVGKRYLRLKDYVVRAAILALMNEKFQ